MCPLMPTPGAHENRHGGHGTQHVVEVNRFSMGGSSSGEENVKSVALVADGGVVRAMVAEMNRLAIVVDVDRPVAVVPGFGSQLKTPFSHVR